MNPLAYTPRLVRTLPPVRAHGRVLKAYAMFARPAERDRVPSPDWLAEQAAAVLEGPAGPGDHEAGFLMLHAGMERDYLLVSQWYDADMLKHWVRGVEVDAEGRTTLVPLEQRQLVACVWELEVVAFERDAWVTTVMLRGRLDRETLDDYLATTFEGWV